MLPPRICKDVRIPEPHPKSSDKPTYPKLTNGTAVSRPLIFSEANGCVWFPKGLHYETHGIPNADVHVDAAYTLNLLITRQSHERPYVAVELNRQRGYFVEFKMGQRGDKNSNRCCDSHDRRRDCVSPRGNSGQVS